MTRRQTKLYNLVMDCYRELYKEATPSADFDELVKNATINDEGEKVIDFIGMCRLCQLFFSFRIRKKIILYIINIYIYRKALI